MSITIRDAGPGDRDEWLRMRRALWPDCPDEKQVRDDIIGAADWEPLSPVEFSASEATRRTELDLSAAMKDLRRHVRAHGEILFHHLTWSTYPHVVLRDRGYVWTSIHLALRKRGGK